MGGNKTGLKLDGFMVNSINFSNNYCAASHKLSSKPVWGIKMLLCIYLTKKSHVNIITSNSKLKKHWSFTYNVLHTMIPHKVSGGTLPNKEEWQRGSCKSWNLWLLSSIIRLLRQYRVFSRQHLRHQKIHNQIFKLIKQSDCHWKRNQKQKIGCIKNLLLTVCVPLHF